MELSKLEAHAKHGDMGPYSKQIAELIAIIRKQEGELATSQSSADAVDAARYRLIRCYKIYGSWPSDAAKNSAVLAFSTCTKHELDEMLDELLGLKLPSNLHQLRSDYVEWRKKSTAQAIDAAIAKREGV